MAPQRDNLSNVKHVILVLSGKGGVGKSTVATQLSLALSRDGCKVGLLDIDLCGPSIPKMLNIEEKDVHQCPEGWVPVFVDEEQRLAVMSIGFLLKNSKDAVVWRGPKKNAMIKQFLSDVYWRDLDYLVIDTPPGTSDEHISVVEGLRQCASTGAVLVTTPQAVSTGDVQREVTFCKKTGVRVIGIVENMSGFVCPHCSECTNVFSKGGGEALAKRVQLPFLGCVPLEPELSRALEGCGNFMELFPDSATNTAIQHITQQIKASCASSNTS